MGLDVNLYAEVDPSVEELARAEEFFTARSDLGDPWGDDKRVLLPSNEGWFEQPRVEVRTMDRYYGKGYERGNWPRIYGAIRVLRAAFPGCRVFYGSDSSDDGQECTDEMLEAVWEHFLGPRGDDYRSRL